MTLSFTRVSIGMALGIIGIVLTVVFIAHPILFPTEPASYCGYYSGPTTVLPEINYLSIIIPIILLAAIYLTWTGFDTSEPEPAADKKKYCPCCGRKLE